MLAALRQGIVVDPDRGPFGGVPERLRPDNGLEFVANAIERSCAALGIALDPAPAYQGYSKGKVERVNRTADQEFLAGLPFYTGGPALPTATFWAGRRPDEPGAVRRLASPSGSGRTTPPGCTLSLGRPRWRGGQPTPRRCGRSPPSSCVGCSWPTAERTIAKDGVHFGGISFIAGALNGRVGERVQVRYMPHDLRHIEVFRGDQWLATAYPQGALSEDQRAEVAGRSAQGRGRARAAASVVPAVAPVPGWPRSPSPGRP